ncbi:MAG: AAA family ATPase [Prevotella sp.]|nr:AAA family ATPase [Prevotella sp.]
MAEKRRKYPLGIQTFSRLIREGYVYVDKTDLVWQMANEDNPFLFLARPRRFGKSLLASTLHSFFAGERELFRGLKAEQLEWDWQQYPVLHFDLSTAKHLAAEEVKKVLGIQLKLMEEEYGRDEEDTTPGMRLYGLVHRAHKQTSKQVVVIVDEYDAPLLDVLHEDEGLKAMRDVLQEFYQNLKALEPLIKCCFITGITKFSQLSIFSTINNISIISMLPKYAALCGITEQELTTTLAPDIALLAREYECTPEEMHRRLKERYDGYMFSERSPEIYNPFSLFKAFSTQKVTNYWFESGTPTFLIRQMQKFNTDITSLNDLEVSASAFDKPTEAMTTALPLLYQSGYLTIKGYDREGEIYTLGIPNQEVQTGYAEGLMPTYIGLDATDVQTGFALKFWRALKKDDIDLALRQMQAFLAGIPYVEGFKKKLEQVAVKEGFYEYTFYLIFNMLNVYARTQVKCQGGRVDMVVLMPQTTYVFELKMHETAQKALEQINTNGYALPYETDGRRVVRVGLHFDLDSRTLDDWVV